MTRSFTQNNGKRLARIDIRLASLHLYKMTFGVMADTSVGQRFSQLIQQLGMSKNAFAMSLDKTATVIQHLVDERNKPGFDLMCKVFEVYPNVSKDWLLLGKEPMLLDDAADVSKDVASEAVATSPVAKPSATPNSTAVPNFPAPLFAVSAARPPLPEMPSLPAAPVVQPPSDILSAPGQPTASALGAAASVPQPEMPAPTASLDAATLTAALHAQYLQHQLALAEQRNQHLLEQQQLMQQMLDLMRSNR
ncbi:hypothetical protein FNT36_15055 [Hymenobacter setariae]|uniref:XRE family transcriptional regulator n=1 Tax=Hymenobacter setariae TaxID=2594794 RepID=A0A558BR55_9BACT|nr:hypothetical protein [Hymenobacter setariae]TVT38988.1 hypothetical protein FNT36_15055 [Hymenobacter setariae]